MRLHLHLHPHGRHHPHPLTMLVVAALPSRRRAVVCSALALAIVVVLTAAAAALGCVALASPIRSSSTRHRRRRPAMMHLRPIIITMASMGSAVGRQRLPTQTVCWRPEPNPARRPCYATTDGDWGSIVTRRRRARAGRWQWPKFACVHVCLRVCGPSLPDCMCECAAFE